METIAVVALSALLMSPVVGLMRTSAATWEGLDGDRSRQLAVHATLRHLAQHLQTCQAVVDISDPAHAAGWLEAVGEDGQRLAWRLDRPVDTVTFQRGAQQDDLASPIEQLRFAGFQADGATPATRPGDIYSLDCIAATTLPGRGGLEVRRRVWIRRLP